MKNKMLNGIAFAVFTVLVIACTPKKQEAPAAVVDKDQIRSELQSMESAFAEAMNLKSVSAINYYSDDVISYSQNKPPVVGKVAIDKSIKEDSDAMQKGSKVSYTANEIFPSNDGNQVVEIGSYVVRDSTDTVIHSGNYMSLFEKRDGKYVCVRDMSASIMPLPKK